MSGLADHARAARILGAAMANRAQQMGDPTGVLTCMADAYLDAALLMDADIRMGVLDHRCTIDHRAITATACPACKKPKGSPQ